MTVPGVLSPDEREIFLRAAEAGAFADLRERWVADADVPPTERYAPDTEVVRELWERVEGLLGRELPRVRAVAEFVSGAFRAKVSDMRTPQPEVFVAFFLTRLLDEPWSF